MPEPALQAPPRTDAPRPDPARGVFETVLVLDGRPIEWDAHIARLERSVAELYPGCAAPGLSGSGIEVERGAMRIDVAPVGRRLQTRVSFREPEPALDAVALRSVELPGGLGPHKWADRSLLDDAQNRFPNALPLIVDADGAVLEASRANVFAVRDGVLSTPPTDGRILPGITRMRVLEIAAALGVESHQANLTRDDLLAADEVFLSGSVRGIERASTLDGAPLGSSGDLSDRIAAGLRRAWAGAKTAAAFG